MKILITGAAGMLGSSMIPVLKEEGHEIYPTDIKTEQGIEYLDVRDYGQILSLSERLKPDFIFHLAAETDLEICENDPRHGYLTNTIGTQNIVIACQKVGAKMVYICTAGIFNGEKDTFYNEFDEVRPLSVYGNSKYEGEKFVRSNLNQYFVFRPGWMIGGGKKDKKFVGKILKQIKNGANELYAVDDKFGTPTYTKDLCRNISQVIKTDFYGVYHAVCRGSASRYDIAREIVKILNKPDIKVNLVHSDYFAKDYPVDRPRSEALDNFMLELRGLNSMRHWREIIKEYLEEDFGDFINKQAEVLETPDVQEKKKKVIVLGAGVAGLACSYKLLQKGAEVFVLEKEKEVGGLARTVKYKDFYFDFSAHRFVGKNKELIEEMKLIMGDSFMKCPKRSRILMWGKWFNYPFELGDLILKMPKGVALKALIDYICALIRQKIKPKKIVSFKDWFIASFGYTLYGTNCLPYASKLWRTDPSQISSEWGEARSPASFNLKTIIRDVLFKKHSDKLEEGNPYPDADSFYYPKHGGSGAITNRFADEIRSLGGTIQVEAEVEKVTIKEDGVEVDYQKDGKTNTIKADSIISTIPIDNLVRVMDPKPSEDILNHLAHLKYLNIIFINVIINRPNISDDSWLYFPQESKEIIFNRAVEFKNWSLTMAPADKTSLCLDVTCMADEPIWRNTDDRQLIEKARDGLIKAKIIDRPEEMEEGIVVKVANAYPIYNLSYADHLDPVIGYLEKSGRLKLLGRTGKFHYLNMDEAVWNGFLSAEEIMSQHDVKSQK